MILLFSTYSYCILKRGALIKITADATEEEG